MTKYALINSSNIVETVVDNPTKPDTFTENGAHWEILAGNAGPGWSWATGNVYTAPTPAPGSLRITVGSFFDRFKEAKYPILASTDPMVKALVTDCIVRRYIDLADSQLPGGLAMLSAAGFGIDTDEILHAPISDDERFTA